MGLPGSGKSTLARKMVEKMNDVEWFNADEVRKEHNDWDFSEEGRLRQARRLRDLCDKSEYKHQVVDFICALEKQRTIFKPDFLIWMDTITEGRYEDTNKAFEPPKEWDMRYTKWHPAN
jgi:adenylylsulfate kinase